MSRRIRDDFEGVVHVPGQLGVTLKAGDEVPEGVEFGDHLFDEVQSEDGGKPAGNASLEDWQEYARSQGASGEDLEGKSRNDLRDAYSD